MLKSRLGDTKEAHLAVLGDYEKQEDVKLYVQLPDYDGSQRYDMGKDDNLRQVALRIYANSHKPSWRTSKHHLCAAKITKKLFKQIK